MHPLTKLIKDDMKPALGVTEPGAIAFAAAKARSYVQGEIESITVSMNSGMYKNAFTCGIPNSTHVGGAYAAALGAIAGDAQRGLEALGSITREDDAAADELIKNGRVKADVSEITSRIFIDVTVCSAQDEAEVTIRDSHTNIVRIRHNGKTVFEKQETAARTETEELPDIHRHTLKKLYDYAVSVDAEEIAFINEAFSTNMALFDEGLASERTVFLHRLLDENGGLVISDDAQKTASLLCNGAIEARVIGLSRPAMSITGSGAHGIIATMPLYAEAKVKGIADEVLLRATALSYLVCMYIKEYSGKLSAFCGCAIAAGTGMACGLALLRGAEESVLPAVIRNLAASITGMICDGGNQGCAMKGIVAVDAAYRAVALAMGGAAIAPVHGICADTPEQTMKNMGLIASPGMVGTENTMIDILRER